MRTGLFSILRTASLSALLLGAPVIVEHTHLNNAGLERSVVSLLGGNHAYAAGKTQMRLYKMDRYGNSQRIRFTSKNAKLEGCHNLKVKRARIHRAVHYGFDYCTLYSEKNCQENSEISAKLGDDEPEQTRLSQGSSWYLGAEIKDDEFYKYSKEERGKKVRSWSCEGYAAPPIKLDY